MRFILLDDVFDELPPDWDEKVASATAFVDRKVRDAEEAAKREGLGVDETEKSSRTARHAAINNKGSVWRLAADALRKASHDKCWYCETRQDRSDKPVDHFRPKNSIAEAPDHPGYHWLAFEWRNLRYSCTFCNSKRRDLDGGTSGGKQDHFPIIEPPPHARCAADPADRPTLLDPTNDNDTKQLTFLRNGFPAAANDNPETKVRVEVSVDLYHLKQIALVRKRKRVAADMEEHVAKAEEAKATGLDPDFRFHKKKIIKMVRARAELSTAARIYLSGYRDKPWVDEIISRDL